jgi:protein-S-isoprenylcysteine O-methyltransferase Ste14
MKQWKMYILSCVWGPLLITQIILVFIFGIFNEAGLDVVMYVGWVIWAISVIFGFLPIFTFKRKGGVAKGKSYVHTTNLVVTGIYSIVRHPQYTAGILFSLALILMAQSWLILALGVVLIPLLYIDIVMADKHEIEKFGDDYKRYMERVPRTNFILGILRILRGRKGESE